jgi:hypothetical protein
VAAGSAAFVLTGTDAGLVKTGSYALAASGGSSTVTGTAAGLAAGRKLSAGAGSSTATGAAVALTASRRVTATAGAYTLTGASATLAYVSGATASPRLSDFILVDGSSRFATVDAVRFVVVPTVDRFTEAD